MSHYNLTICMPSNRDLIDSRGSISSAINFCDLTNSELIVSDNSNDIKKSNYWSNLNLNFLKYDSEAPSDSNNNWYNALSKSEGLYAGVLSDDDLILNIDHPVMEYNEIYNNNILGIKPIIQLWNGSVGAYNINNFNISDDTAKLRLISYLNNANGNNTTLYSFYNKKVFLDLLKLSLSHPTRGGYTDWAFVAGLVSSGKILVDSSKLLLYKNTNWFGTQEYINEQDRKLYEKAGLNERLYLFGKLLRALDSFIYVIRKNSPVTREEAIDAAFYIYEVNFKGFLNDIKINNINYNNFEKKISLKIDIASHIEEKLNLTLDVIESLDSELSKKYKIFYENALETEWGIIK